MFGLIHVLSGFEKFKSVLHVARRKVSFPCFNQTMRLEYQRVVTVISKIPTNSFTLSWHNHVTSGVLSRSSEALLTHTPCKKKCLKMYCL